MSVYSKYEPLYLFSMLVSITISPLSRAFFRPFFNVKTFNHLKPFGTMRKNEGGKMEAEIVKVCF